MTKLRLSNHNLMIESGRHKKVPKELRFCPFCPNTIENEMYFLLECPTYENMRIIVFHEITTNHPNFQFYSLKEKFEHIMVNLDKDVSLLIANSFKIRNLLLTNPKRRD